jgi:hypothetical protein
MAEGVSHLIVCVCCGTSEEETEIDAASGLCLYCQPCPRCGRLGTGCDDTLGRCDP